MLDNYFPDDFIGQETLKRAVSFKLAAYKETKIFRPTLITGTRGMGKTKLASIIGKNLLDRDGNPKNCYEIGCQSIKGVGDFVGQIVDRFCVGDDQNTIFLDEVHLIPPKVMGFLLQVFNTTDDGNTRAQFDGLDYSFSLSNTSWIMATTNKEQLVKPLLDRCINQFEMESYTLSELGKILLRQTPNIQYENDQFVDQIASYGRNNPRTVFAIAEHLNDFCRIHHSNIITLNDWESIKNHLGMYPFNLSNSEVLTLHILNTDGPSKLTHLASKLQLDPQTVRRTTEHFLLANNLIKIDTKREITRLGREVLSKCDLQRIKSRALIN